MKTQCPNCQMPIYRDRKTINFASGASPIHAIEIVIDAEWCPTPECYQHCESHSHIDHRNGDFVDTVVRVRDWLVPIATGEIERGRPISTYDAAPGNRKTTIKDAKPIAKRAIDRLNLAVNKFTEGIF